jgi:hypothetical protein
MVDSIHGGMCLDSGTTCTAMEPSVISENHSLTPHCAGGSLLAFSHPSSLD